MRGVRLEWVVRIESRVCFYTNGWEVAAESHVGAKWLRAVTTQPLTSTQPPPCSHNPLRGFAWPTGQNATSFPCFYIALMSGFVCLLWDCTDQILVGYTFVGFVGWSIEWSLSINYLVANCRPRRLARAAMVRPLRLRLKRKALKFPF